LSDTSAASKMVKDELGKVESVRVTRSGNGVNFVCVKSTKGESSVLLKRC
jgi:hypothetical protein